MSKQKKIRQHRFVDRFPVLAAVVLPFVALVLLQALGSLISLPFGVIPALGKNSAIGYIICSLLVMWLFKRWFYPEFEGNLRGGRPGLGFRLGLFILIAWALVPVNMIRHPENYAVPTLATLSIALMAGFAEETAFRGLSLSYLMRQWKDEKKLLTALLFTSALFGLVHLGNLFSGANVVLTLLQLISTFAAGLFLGAVYLRSGNLWPSIVLHTLHDIVSLLDVSSISGGVMTGNLRLVDLLDLLLSVILGGIGLWLIRPAKRGEILAVWREKWQPLPDTKM